MTVTKLNIENLRGVRDGEISGLSPLSILVGPNNCGKSTALEAIATVATPYEGSVALGRLLRRGGPPLHMLGKIFHGDIPEFAVSLHTRKGSEEVVLRSDVNVLEVRDVERLKDAQREGLTEPIVATRMHFTSSASPDAAREMLVHVDGSGRLSQPFVRKRGQQPQPNPLPMSFVDVEAVRSLGELEDAYSSLESVRRIPEVVAALKRSMPKLTDLRILKENHDFILHALVGDEPPTPVYAAGDGFKRLLNIAAALYAKDSKLVLLEEPECFQHPRYLGELVAILRGAVAANKQVILSTHSMELIDQLIALPDEGEAPVEWPTVHRLRLTNGVLRATTLSAEQARVARDELLEDLRS